MANKPLVSVIMPAYNASGYIIEAVESILNQSFKRFELIIIDDCSKDKTLQIAKSFSKKDKRIRVYRNKKNLKIAGTLNRGIRLAKAEFVARMDADDVSHPKRLELQYKIISRQKNTSIIGANMEIINESGTKVSKRSYPTTSKELKKIMFKYSPFAHPVVMYKKKAVLDFGGYDEKMVPCEDIDLWFKLGSLHDFASIDKSLLKYRVLPTYSKKYNLKYIEKLGFKIKLKAISKYNYKPSIIDLFYNLGQYLTIWMPQTFRIKLYDLLRSKEVI